MEILRDCKKAEVFDQSGGLLCEASVSAGPMGGILLTIPRSLEIKSQAFQILFYDPTLGMLTCRCALSSPLPLPDDKQSVRCDILERLSQKQRRDNKKYQRWRRISLHRFGSQGGPPGPL